MTLTEQLTQANAQAIDAHEKAAAIALELLVALVELGKVHKAYTLRLQIDYHNSVVKKLKHGQFDA